MRRIKKLSQDEFEQAVFHVISKRCWSSIAGTGTGSHVSFHFGERIKRKTPLTNDKLTQEERLYDGEYGLFVECTWRIDSKTEVIAGAWETYEEGTGTSLTALKKLVGIKILDLEIIKPANDLNIHFDNGLTLKLFCDSTNEEEGYDNWTFFTQEHAYTVGTKGRLYKEEVERE